MDLLQETERSKPVFVLVHGAWHTPAAFDTLVPFLHAAGYFTTCVSLPSVGISPGLKDFSADVLAVRATVSALVELGKDVVVVAHSYGGIPTTEALRDLSKSEVLENGGDGGVTRLVYIAAHMVGEGKSCADPVDGIKPEDRTPTACQHVFHGDDTFSILNAEECFYGDCPPKLSQYFAKLLKTHSIPCFQSKVTYEAFFKIPTAYLICSEDKALPLVYQEAMVKYAKPEMVETIETEHSPFISQPNVVADFLIRAAGRER